MKTPDDIKKGLECCSCLTEDSSCNGCPYDNYGKGKTICAGGLEEDALAYINQLEQRFAQAERERDAAVADLAVHKLCDSCVDGSKDIDREAVNCFSCSYKSNWQWRGVCEENSKEETNG